MTQDASMTDDDSETVACMQHHARQHAWMPGSMSDTAPSWSRHSGVVSSVRMRRRLPPSM